MPDDDIIFTELVIETPEPTTLVVEPPQEVMFLAVAEQGPEGPPGPPGGGNGGGTYYSYQQSAPSMTWIITHNLGFMPDVVLFSVGGVEIEGEIVHISNNVANALFVVPVAGSARCH